jgi:hypothetical protein
MLVDNLKTNDGITIASYHMEALSPDFWDAPPDAAIFRDATQGFPEHLLLGKILPDIIKKVKKMISEEKGGKRFKCQRYIAEELQRALYSDSIPLLIKRRFPVLEPSIQYESIDFPRLQEFMQALSPAWATSIIKTWANAWTTSSRMHETEIKTCLFGCPQEHDELNHYLRCLRFQTLLRNDNAQLHISETLLFMKPSVENALLLVTAFNAYHAVKNTSRPHLARLVDASRGQAMSAAPRI